MGPSRPVYFLETRPPVILDEYLAVWTGLGGAGSFLKCMTGTGDSQHPRAVSTSSSGHGSRPTLPKTSCFNSCNSSICVQRCTSNEYTCHFPPNVSCVWWPCGNILCVRKGCEGQGAGSMALNYKKCCPDHFFQAVSLSHKCIKNHIRGYQFWNSDETASNDT